MVEVDNEEENHKVETFDVDISKEMEYVKDF